MVVADNFYLYAKHVYHYEGVEASVDIINQHFNQKNNQPAIKLIGDELKNYSFSDRFSFYDFEVTLDILLNPPTFLTPLSIGGELETDYATFFIEMWEAVPSWRTFSFLNFPEAEISKDTQDRILNRLYESVREGWISFKGLDKEAFDPVARSFCGRVYLDIVDLTTERNDILGLDLTDLFLTVASEVEDKSPFIHPLDFWNYQLAHNPRKIVHMLINTLFRRYSNVDSAINFYLNKALSRATYFVDASIKAIQILIDTLSVDELNYYPMYAGYAQVDDAKSWLLQLIELIKERRDISILPGSRLVNNVP